MKKEKRFEIIYKQGHVDVIEIMVDKETGVNYLYRTAGYAGGLTPLLDSDGNVIISPDKKTNILDENIW